MMLKRVVILLMLSWLGYVVSLADDAPALTDTLLQVAPMDTITAMDTIAVTALSDSVLLEDIDVKNAWKKRIFRHGWSINDTTIVYPRALNFGFKAYRWINHALNFYDTTYVVNPGKTKGKKFKVMLKNSNWLDFYSGHLGKWETPVQLNSDVTSLFGFHISGMGLSFTYMFNVRDLLAGKFIHNRRLQFSFTTSRIFIEGYYRKNDESSVHLHRLGKWLGDEIFYGLKRESYGLDAYYIFNHTHYSQAAAYCFSKYQKRSAGSLMAGIYLSHQDVVMNMGILSDQLRKFLPGKVTDYRFRYRDFGFMIGPSPSATRGTGTRAPTTASTIATATLRLLLASASEKNEYLCSLKLKTDN